MGPMDRQTFRGCPAAVLPARPHRMYVDIGHRTRVTLSFSFSEYGPIKSLLMLFVLCISVCMLGVLVVCLLCFLYCLYDPIKLLINERVPTQGTGTGMHQACGERAPGSQGECNLQRDLTLTPIVVGLVYVVLMLTLVSLQTLTSRYDMQSQKA